MRFLAAFILCAFLSGCGANASHNQSKLFRFENYSHGRAAEEIKNEFPIGLSRQRVEEKLINEGGARIVPLQERKPVQVYGRSDTNKHIIYRYDTTDAFISYGYTISATYDLHDALVYFSVSSGRIPSGRVDPKQHPLSFSIIPWMKPHNETAELTSLLESDFPVGTPRNELEKYILASGELTTSKPQKYPAKPGYYLGYFKETPGLMGCTYSIKAHFSEQDILLESPQSFALCRAMIEL